MATRPTWTNREFRSGSLYMPATTPPKTNNPIQSLISQRLNSPTNQKFPEAGTWEADYRILRELVKYLWPANQPSIKIRVVIAIVLLVSGKLLNVYVPIFFKHVVDALSPTASGATTSSIGGVMSLFTPDMALPTIAGALLIGYGAARLGAVLSQELRNAVFGAVAQRAIRDAARNIFGHLHQLDLSFHVARQTGGLVRAIDRGTKGINQILSSVVFHVFPTALEIGLVCGILAYSVGWEFVAVNIVTMSAYTLFTFLTTAWRTKFRKQMNAADNQAASVASDSLLNFEAVKNFNNEKFEMKQYDSALAKYEVAALKTTSSLAFLNAGQSAIISVGLTSIMWMAAQGVIAGTMTVGDLVM
ncbi:Iron-sulfur clusters transporter atm1, mitochondrial, partial [Chytridiales sp. JEL 0842]